VTFAHSPPSKTVTYRGKKMDCKNHPGVNAVGRCAGCAEDFCNNCLLEIRGAMYCGSCKTMEATNAGIVSQEPTTPCSEANIALILSIVGICCWFIVEPIALVFALIARAKIAKDPSLSGSGKVIAALIISITLIVLGVIGTILRFTVLSRP